MPVMFSLASGCKLIRGKEQKPNVLILMIDGLRIDGLGCYGNPHDVSPALDAYSRRGVRFTNTFSHSSHTKISVAALFSGLSPPANGVRSCLKAKYGYDKMPPDILTLAELFKLNGYRTGAVSANPYVSKDNRFDQGFDEFYYFIQVETELIGAGQINEHALFWLESKPADQPYFLYVHYMDVHYPYQPPETYRKRFTRGLSGSRPYFPRGKYDDTMEITKSELEYTRAFYNAEVRYWDDEFMKFMTELNNKDLLSDTMVVILADHGEEFFEHRGFGHNFTVYEETLRIPLIVVYPGKVPSGLVRDDMVRLIDLYPAIAGLAGLDVSGLSLEGRDLFKEGYQGTPGELSDEHALLFAEACVYPLPACLRTATEKIIYNRDKDDWEFYRLDRDPGEKINLYDPSNPRIKELADRLNEMINRRPLFKPDPDETTGKTKKMDEQVRKALKSLGYMDY